MNNKKYNYIRNIITEIYDFLEDFRISNPYNKNLRGVMRPRSKLLREIYDLSNYKMGKKKEINFDNVFDIFYKIKEYYEKSHIKYFNYNFERLDNLINSLENTFNEYSGMLLTKQDHNKDMIELKKKYNEIYEMVGGNQFINIPKYGRRKIRYQKNGKAYVIVNKKKLKL